MTRDNMGQSAMAHIVIFYYFNLTTRCITRGSAPVGQLAGRIQQLRLCKVRWILTINRALFAVGIERVIHFVGLHHETQRVAPIRFLSSIEQFIFSIRNNDIGNVIVDGVIDSIVDAGSQSEGIDAPPPGP
jgi:hypothetical protein